MIAGNRRVEEEEEEEGKREKWEKAEDVSTDVAAQKSRELLERQDTE